MFRKLKSDNDYASGGPWVDIPRFSKIGLKFQKIMISIEMHLRNQGFKPNA